MNRLTVGTRYLLLVVAFVLCPSCVATGADGPISTLSKPYAVIDLAKVGLMDPPPESDKSFFRDFSIEKLEARDDGVKIAYLTDDVLVAYHTTHESQEGKDWRTVHRDSRHFSSRARDGELLFKKRWLTRWRKDTSDVRELEARIIRVSDGRFWFMPTQYTCFTQAQTARCSRKRCLSLQGSVISGERRACLGGRYILCLIP